MKYIHIVWIQQDWRPGTRLLWWLGLCGQRISQTGVLYSTSGALVDFIWASRLMEIPPGSLFTLASLMAPATPNGYIIHVPDCHKYTTGEKWGINSRRNVFNVQPTLDWLSVLCYNSDSIPPPPQPWSRCLLQSCPLRRGQGCLWTCGINPRRCGMKPWG